MNDNNATAARVGRGRAMAEVMTQVQEKGGSLPACLANGYAQGGGRDSHDELSTTPDDPPS
jgi:hypothetical protein